MRRRAWLWGLVAAAVSAAAPQAAHSAPDVLLDVGGTFANTGDVGDGGFSLSLAAMWSFGDRYAFGIAGFADDMGAEIGPLLDPNDGTDLGSTELAHRSVIGGAWRADANLPGRWQLEPYVSGSWGVYRVADDHYGDRHSAVGSTGFSLGGGVTRPLGRGSLGAVVRYHRLFNDVVGRYWSAAAEWRWNGSLRP
jgi:hypothetical protein